MVKNKISLEVVNFREEMDRIEKEVRVIVKKDLHFKTDYATEQLIRTTPVDTGKARSGWYNKKYKTLVGEQEAIIKNDVEYVGKLNQGHSQQAPKYFIEQVLIQIGILTPY